MMNGTFWIWAAVIALIVAIFVADLNTGFITGKNKTQRDAENAKVENEKKLAELVAKQQQILEENSLQLVQDALAERVTKAVDIQKALENALTESYKDDPKSDDIGLWVRQIDASVVSLGMDCQMSDVAASAMAKPTLIDPRITRSSTKDATATPDKVEQAMKVELEKRANDPKFQEFAKYITYSMTLLQLLVKYSSVVAAMQTWETESDAAKKKAALISLRMELASAAGAARQLAIEIESCSKRYKALYQKIMTQETKK